ncbi:MAG: hypothetical protein GF353_12085 [Candidatus Lokiarchaeota archaeon]|nr:hypothetical protein [Candidatus Lokiarchaeota archaeon]
MALELIDLMQGSFSLIYVMISVVVGSRILSKYFEHKTRDYILVGITWIGLANPWMPDSISFVLILIINTPLSAELYFIIGNVFIPVILLCWLTAFTDLVYKNKQKLILGLFLVFGIIFELLFFYLLLTDIDEIGKFIGPFQVEFGLLIQILLISTIVIMFITGVIFSRESLKSEDKKLKLKGKLLLTAFISFTLGAILDSSIGALDPILVALTRIILISSSIEFYMGFTLPKWVEKLFFEK